MEKQNVKEATEPVKKQNSMLHLKIYNKQDILSLTRIRRFETKLGERLQVVQDTSDIAGSLATSTAKYVFVWCAGGPGRKRKFRDRRNGYVMDPVLTILLKYSKQ